MRNAARRGLAVGFFDGVHLGHRAILRNAASVLTFRNHPLAVLAPERAPRLLMSVEERLSAIRACGVESVIALDFDKRLASMTAEEFLSRHMGIAQRDGVVYCGDNWRFGCGGVGDARFLKAHGIKVEVLPYAVYKGERISSTRIRSALEAGEVEDATAMLGRPWTAVGEVFKGKGVGAALGFPTVNIRLVDMNLLLRRGVYAVEACGRKGIANYGMAPTFGEKAWKAPVLEIHFVDVVPSIAEAIVCKISFTRFIRAEMKFASAEDLRHQISTDIANL